MKNRSEKHQEILTELNNLNTTNTKVILLAQLAICSAMAPYISANMQALVRRAAIAFPFLLEIVNCW